MIRIDEIYNHTFWPFIKKRIPLTRMLYCDPPGKSDSLNLTSHGIHNVQEFNYILFHDQEPIHLDIHSELFDSVKIRTENLNDTYGPYHKAIVTSEHNSEAVEEVCRIYGWKHYYYFFHGWASLDWYRGYDMSFLMPEPTNRIITKSFISPNRIIGGKRKHRVDLMYLLLTRKIKNAHISFPEICPAEKQHILDIAMPEQKSAFTDAGLPWNFAGEKGHPMHSCYLSLFAESAESLAYLVTETVYAGRRHHLTEKIFKPICLGMPFVLASTAGSLRYLRSYGFKTFDSVWDESYDLETDDKLRLEKIADLLKYLDSLSTVERRRLFEDTLPIIAHNYNHFYNGEFKKILWEELSSMLNCISRDFEV
jgi:hypothetical protein